MPANNQSKSKTKPKRVQANRSTTTASSQTRSKRAKLLNTVATQSTLWKNTAKINSSGAEVIAAGEDIEKDDAKISELELALSTVRTSKVLHVSVFDKKFEIYVTNVEDTVTDEKQLQELALEPLVETTYTLATPLSLTLKSDPMLHDISVQVKRAPGMSRCDIEVSSDLTMATGVKSFPGDGSRQSMGPFTPGTYAVRARHVRSAESSAYTEIVTINVK